jgi:hypothetical protein
MTRPMLVLTLALVASSTARAGDRPERRAIDEASRRQGVGRDTVRLAAREARADAQALTQALSSRLASNPAEARSTTLLPGAARPAGGDWQVRLRGDGSVGELARSNRDAPIAVDRRLHDDVLVARARSFVDATLVAPLGIRRQDIYALKTAHQIRQAMSKSGVKTPERVVSSAVTFGRKLDGLPVVGPGSKIVVELSPTGEVVGVRYDWARLTLKNERQATVAMDTLVRRGTDHTRLRAQRTRDYSRMECGYYDEGAESADPQAPLQAACVVQEVRRDAAVGTIAIEEVVPAGQEVRRDKGWPLAQRVIAAQPPTAPSNAPGVAP